MDYRALIKRQVKTAFKQVSSLATKVNFTIAEATGYNFNTQTTIANSPVVVILIGIPTIERSGGRKSTGTSGLTNTLLKSLDFIADEIGHPDIYDTATFDNDPIKWKPVPPFESDGYITTIIFAREN